MINNQQPSDKRVLRILTVVNGLLNGVAIGALGFIAAIVLGVISESGSGMHALLIVSLILVIVVQPNVKWRIVALILAAGVYGLLLLR